MSAVQPDNSMPSPSHDVPGRSWTLPFAAGELIGIGISCARGAEHKSGFKLKRII